jgi:D-cysteine desulfhydrase
MSMNKLELFEHPLTPTPIIKLSGHYDGELGNEIYVKREDMIPFSFGGNKARHISTGKCRMNSRISL